MHYKINIKPFSINKAFKGRRFKTNECNIFIKEVLFLLPKKIEYPDKKNVKLASLQILVKAGRLKVTLNEQGVKLFQQA